jgi:hypothetical protein
VAVLCTRPALLGEGGREGGREIRDGEKERVMEEERGKRRGG